MTGFIASLFDHGLMIVCFGWIAYRQYQREKDPAAVTKPWLVAISFVLIVYHAGAFLYDCSTGFPAASPPINAGIRMQTSDEIGALFKREAKPATDETIITLDKGPRITIPRGYKFITPKDGAVQLVALGRIGERIVVSFLGEESDLDKIELSAREYAKKNNRNWSLGAGHPEILFGCNAKTIDFNATSPDLIGYVTLVTNGKYAFELMVASPTNLQRAKQAEFFKAVHSFNASF